MHGISFLSRAATPAIIAVTLASCGPPASTTPPDPRLPEHGQLQVGSIQGAPSAAQATATVKRLPLDATVDTARLYRAAERHAARMPRYSTALGRRLHRRDLRATTALGKWKWLGPGNIGGRTRTLVIDPQRPNTMYAGGVSGGVWRTTNAGRKWKALGDALANIAVNAMAIHPQRTQTIVVGTGEGYFREDVRGTGLPLRGGGIFVSTNRGNRWQLLESTTGEDFWFVNDLVYSADGERLYAGTRTGVHRSDDGGATWTRILDPNVKGGCLDLALRTDVPGDVLFASCGTFEQATVWRSGDAATRNAAASFEAVLSDPGMGRTTIAIAPSDQEVIYALAASNRKGPYEQALHAVFRSTTGGGAGSWAPRIRNSSANFEDTLLLHNSIWSMLDECGFGGTEIVLPMGWYVNALAVDPVNSEIVWAGGVTWFRSDDGGRNWGSASYGFGSGPTRIHVDQHRLAFHPRYDGAGNQTLYVGNDGGVFRTDNGRAPVATASGGLCSPGNSAVAWTALNNNLGITQFYHGTPYPDGSAFVAGAQDNGTMIGQVGRPQGWTPVFGGDGGYSAVDPRDTDVLYVQSQSGNLQKSTDGGLTFNPARNGLPPSDGRFLDPGGNFVFIPPLTMDPQDPDTLWLGAKRVYRTVDGAANWQAASRATRGRVTAISVAPSDSGRVLLGTEKGYVHRRDNALAAGAGTVWASSRPRKAWATWVAHDPQDPDIAYVTYGGFGGKHVYRSSDGGRSWVSIDGTGATGLPDIPVHAIVVDPVDTARLYLGTDLGVFVSVDGGATWAQENTGFGNIVTESLALQREGGVRRLYAFTHGRGAYRVTVAG